jgi:hypothetical protein
MSTGDYHLFWIGRLLSVAGFLADHPEFRLDTLSSDGTPALNWVARHNRHAEIVAMLRARPHDPVDMQDADGRTTLHSLCACRSNYVPDLRECVTMLLKRSRDVNIRDSLGCTALHLACMPLRCPVHVSWLLCDPRILPNLRNSDGRTPLDLAFNIDMDCEADRLRAMLKSPRVELGARVWTPFEIDVCLDAIIATSRTFDVSKETIFPNSPVPLLAWATERPGRGYDHIRTTIRAYLKDPDMVYHRARTNVFFAEAYSATTFALAVLVSDGYLSVCPYVRWDGFNNEQRPETRRFWRIVRRLPIELQMIVCNRSRGLARDGIGRREVEGAIRCLVSREYPCDGTNDWLRIKERVHSIEWLNIHTALDRCYYSGFCCAWIFFLLIVGPSGFGWTDIPEMLHATLLPLHIVRQVRFQLLDRLCFRTDSPSARIRHQVGFRVFNIIMYIAYHVELEDQLATKSTQPWIAAMHHAALAFLLFADGLYVGSAELRYWSVIGGGLFGAAGGAGDERVRPRFRAGLLTRDARSIWVPLCGRGFDHLGMERCRPSPLVGGMKTKKRRTKRENNKVNSSAILFKH